MKYTLRRQEIDKQLYNKVININIFKFNIYIIKYYCVYQLDKRHSAS